VALGVVVGGGIGAVLAKKVEMTKMPELVAAMHSLIGLAPCVSRWLPCRSRRLSASRRLAKRCRSATVSLFIGTFVGAITFSGSVIAFGKLSGKYKFRLFQGAPVNFAGQHMLNLLALAMVGLGWCSAS
jgi:NAD(P) transhydrogenase subunit beta